ncbi:DUF4832 domain-containing protein [Pedobacter sp. MC2016-14]|uniref:DUF4832 domain-containing protein n=1 Tax=Pedobacter sp. MC2016-14 TaxID=2897327 RepID=UPI001E38942B|nr:DUF4832 domain-containing protein [Pedobacter sp. MC2016-14]MCD0489557.1 DUF4832 domain-containing protein [Pedobacter sp. MC2016-14]
MKRTHHRFVVKTVLVVSLCCPIFISASKYNVVHNKGNDQVNYTSLKPKYNSKTVLRNPLNGWVMYASRSADESYWDTEYFVPQLNKKVKALDYASACYIRTSWSSLNPKDGMYAWNDPGSRIAKLIKGAEKRGLPIAFRIVVDGRDQGQNTPQFVFKAGAKYYLENTEHPDRQTPYPQDLVFKKYYTKFIEALAKEFNDPVRTAFIDAYGLGKWGEAHHVVYQDPKIATSEDTEKLKEEVFDWVTDLYSRTFTKVPLVINYHRLVGHSESWAAANPNSDRLLVKAIEKGYSLRHDAFGMTGYYQGWEKDFARKWNFKRPIIMEGGWITSRTHRYWTDPSGKYKEGHAEDVRQGEYEASAEAHVNMMDFRSGDTDSWFEKAFSLVQGFVSEGGYRLYPDQINLPDHIKSNASAKITHRWKNMGWGYFPNNIPQWNYKYKVAFALLDAENKVKRIFVDKESEPSNWLKDKPLTYDLKTTVDLPVGKYSWAVAIVDTTKENRPAIKLALDAEVTAGGWNRLNDLQVQ